MSNATEAADFLKRQVALMAGFAQAAEALDRIGSMELAAKEAEAARAKAEAGFAEANDKLSSINAEIAFAEGKAAEIMAEAKTQAAETTAELLDAARSEAQRLMDSAATNAIQASESAQFALQSALAAVASEEGKLATLKKATSVQSQVCDDLTQECAKLSKAIEAMKAKFA